MATKANIVIEQGARFSTDIDITDDSYLIKNPPNFVNFLLFIST